MNDEKRDTVHAIWRRNALGPACRGCPMREVAANCRVAGGYYGGDITFVLDRPDESGVLEPRGLPHTEVGRMLQRACDYAARALDIDFNWNYVYLTGAPHDRTLKSVTNHCAAYMLSRLVVLEDHRDRDTPHVLIPLGSDATAFFLGKKQSFEELRSLAHTWEHGQLDYTVVPSITPRTLFRSRGAVDVLASDIAMALRVVHGIEDELPAETSQALIRDYVFPTSDDALLELTEEIIAYTGKPGPDGVPAEEWPIAVDSETTGLKAWLDGHHPFAVSVSWDEGKATTILLEHEKMEYSPEVARECVVRLMACPKPKIFHNYKFDYQHIALKAGMSIKNVWFDTLLAAHFLRGDMSGFYGLGKLVPLYVPRYSGYKAMIKTALRQRVIDRIQENLNQEAPNYEESTTLAAFFPEVDYAPAIERLTEEQREAWRQDDLAKLFRCELAYIKAHVGGDKKAKTRHRGKVRRLCKKYGVEVPDIIKDRDFDAELDSDGGYEHVPYDVLLVYAAIDADVTRQICKAQRAAAWEMGCDYHQRTRGQVTQRSVLDDMMRVMNDECVRLSHALGHAEYIGIAVDKERMGVYARELDVRVDKTTQAMRDILVWHDFVPSKSADLETAVRQRLSVPQNKFQYTEKTGALSVTSDWIDARADDDDLDASTRQFFRELRAYKSASKALSGFVDQLERLSADDERVHTQFNLNGTVTGRLSASRPSLQNFPLRMGKGDYPGHPGWNIKALFIPDGEVMWQLDIASAEIRVLAAYANDQALTKAILDGLDFHSFTASECFDYTYEEILAKKETDPEIKLLRSATKRVVFGLVYGAGPYTLATQIFGELSDDPEERERQVQFAADTMAKIKTRFSGIQRYTQETEMFASSYGFATTYLGRYRRFDMRDTSRYARAKAMRQAVNFRIQSTSAGLVNAQLCEVYEHLHELPGVNLQLTVHDSMVGSCKLDALPAMRAFFDRHIVESIQENYPWMPVPFAYDLEIGPTYGEKFPFEMYERYAATSSPAAFVHVGEDGTYEKDYRELAWRCGLLTEAQTKEEV